MMIPSAMSSILHTNMRFMLYVLFDVKFNFVCPVNQGDLHDLTSPSNKCLVSPSLLACNDSKIIHVD